MLAITRLIVFIILCILLAVQCSQSDQLDNIEEKVDRIYDSQCLYCSRLGILESQDG